MSKMSKIEKKKQKIKDQISFLEKELTESLTKKTSNVKEINVASQYEKINKLQKELLLLK